MSFPIKAGVSQHIHRYTSRDHVKRGDLVEVDSFPRMFLAIGP